MSVETGRLEELGRELGERIAELPEYRAFEEAKAAVESDDELQEQIAKFERLREEYALARQRGEAGREDVAELQQVQQDLHDQPLMAEYLEAKDALTERLEAVNRAISEPLAVDFGGEAGGCCRD